MISVITKVYRRSVPSLILKLNCGISLILIISLNNPLHILGQSSLSVGFNDMELKINREVLIPNHGCPLVLAFSRDGSSFFPAVVETPDSLLFLNEDGSIKKAIKDLKKQISKVSISENQKFVLLESDVQNTISDYRVKVFNISGMEIWQLQNSSIKQCGGTYLSTNGKYIVCTSPNDALPINPPTFLNSNGQLNLGVIPFDHKGKNWPKNVIEAVPLAFSDDGSLVGFALRVQEDQQGKSSMVCVMDDNARIKFLQESGSNYIMTMKFSFDKRHLVSAGFYEETDQSVVQLWDLIDGKLNWQVILQGRSRYFPFFKNGQQSLMLVGERVNHIVSVDQLSGEILNEFSVEKTPDFITMNAQLDNENLLLQGYSRSKKELGILMVIDLSKKEAGHQFYKASDSKFFRKEPMAIISHPDAVQIGIFLDGKVKTYKAISK